MGGTDSIEFFARYKDWLAVKKISIDGGTKPEEVVLQLAGIRQSIDRKAFELLGVDTKAIDEYAADLTKGMRKSYGALAQVVQKLGTGEAKEAVKNACKGRAELEGIAATYLFRRTAQSLTFDFDVNQDLLQKAYPGLKVPRPPGRKPKA